MPGAVLRRRDFLRTSALTAGALALGPAYFREALAAGPTHAGNGPYGPMGAADANGIRLPQGFSSRVVAQAGVPVLPSGYVFPPFPDGSATFALPGGGWALAVNSEVPEGNGGASAIRFAADGAISGAGRILGGTTSNCAGGLTPWGTWLSCEEYDQGTVWECDPTGAKAAVQRRALGVFSHEAVCVDRAGGRLYLSEDNGESGFYRFTPEAYPNLDRGTLEVAIVGADGAVQWVALPDPQATQVPTRNQVPGTTRFRRGEGIFFSGGVVYLVTTSDSKVHAYDTSTERIEVLYDGEAPGASLPGKDIDNIWVHRPSGDIFICEDPDDLQLTVLTPDREIAPFLQFSGPQHGSGEAVSEVTGVSFDPSGKRMYVSSQRALGLGQTYEIAGPFRVIAPPAPASGTGGGGGGGAPAGEAADAPEGLAARSGSLTVRRPLNVRVPRSIALSTLRRRGLLVTLIADEAGAYDVEIVARRARQLERPVTTRLARRRRTLRAGQRVALRVSADAAALSRVARAGRGGVTLEVRVTTSRPPERRLTLPVRLYRFA